MLLNPCAVRPLGNSLTDGDTATQSRRGSSLGTFSVLPDTLVVRVLDTLVQNTPHDAAATALTALSATSTYLRAFACDEDLWRRLVISNSSPTHIASVSRAQSWRSAYRLLVASSITHAPTPRPGPPVYSDILFHKWRCLTSPISPSWISRDNVQRISAKTTSAAAFRNRFESSGIPVVIRDVASTWPACNSWTPASLAQRFQNETFHAGGFNFTLDAYFQYCENVSSRDDQPLYIFDHSFVAKAPELAADYSVPEYFSEDLFKVLGEDHRPDYRWLIAGPKRSGSSFHKDPNATSAWNAVVYGEKKWVMFPPDCPPPGVMPSGDEGDVTAPVSVMEWFLNFYDQGVLDEYGAVECLVKPGEIMFVPMGWWHCVLNTKTSIAITQNYVSESNVGHVVSWLRERPGQVSGCRSGEQASYICRNFARLVTKTYQHLDSKVGNDRRESTCLATQEGGSQVSRKKRIRSLWQTLQTSAANEPSAKRNSAGSAEIDGKMSTTFSFGF